MCSVRHSVGWPPLRRGFVLIAVALAVFALSAMARAVLPPPAPDGGYPNANTAEGDFALFSLTTGFNNTGNGYKALYAIQYGGNNTASGTQALVSNISGSNNTATGFDALFRNDADNNTANGFQALYNNTTGVNNTATGYQALYSNNTYYNTANGFQALYSNTTGGYNTANGVQALAYNTTGSQNVANGFQALVSNTTGIQNTANGFQALFSNTTGPYNTATGVSALQSNTTGDSNTANGVNALYNNTTGGANTANGVAALQLNTTGFRNTANGYQAFYSNTTGSYNVVVGYRVGFNLTTGDNNIDIGNYNPNTGSTSDVAGESNTIRIGYPAAHSATFIAGINGAMVTGVAVTIDATTGQLGTLASSQRFKDQIKPMNNASEAILSLKPVTFRYKHELDPKGIPQFGLVAEEVEKVSPDLVVRDGKGEVYSVRYEAVNAMLLNEFLKEHSTVQELKSIVARQEATIAQQQKGMEVMAVSLKEQAAKIQKVSDRVELKQPGPQMAANDQ